MNSINLKMVFDCTGDDGVQIVNKSVDIFVDTLSQNCNIIPSRRNEKFLYNYEIVDQNGNMNPNCILEVTNHIKTCKKTYLRFHKTHLGSIFCYYNTVNK